jgi:hypothetical protein
MGTGARDAVSQLKDLLCKTEWGLICAGDAGDELIFDQADPTAVAKQMITAVRTAREHLDAAHELLRTDLHNDGDDDDDGDNELSDRSRQLHVFDRIPVGEVERAAPSLGGGADLQSAIWRYWGAR